MSFNIFMALLVFTSTNQIKPAISHLCTLIIRCVYIHINFPRLASFSKRRNLTAVNCTEHHRGCLKTEVSRGKCSFPLPPPLSHDWNTRRCEIKWESQRQLSFVRLPSPTTIILCGIYNDCNKIKNISRPLRVRKRMRNRPHRTITKLHRNHNTSSREQVKHSLSQAFLERTGSKYFSA